MNKQKGICHFPDQTFLSSATLNEKYETIAIVKFLEKGYSFDGCDTVRLYDYLIYYEQQAIIKNIDDEKRIKWFGHHMVYGSHVIYQLKDEQKQTWTEFKQNLLEAYKRHDEVRMSCQFLGSRSRNEVQIHQILKTRMTMFSTRNACLTHL